MMLRSKKIVGNGRLVALRLKNGDSWTVQLQSFNLSQLKQKKDGTLLTEKGAAIIDLPNAPWATSKAIQTFIDVVNGKEMKSIQSMNLSNAMQLAATIGAHVPAAEIARHLDLRQEEGVLNVAINLCR